MLKRRRLTPGTEIVLIYDTNLGFIQQSARFKEYRSIIINTAEHDIPIFERKGPEITGLECFWLLAKEADAVHIERIQRELIDLQIKALEIGKLKNYVIPEKIKDKEIRLMAEQKTKLRAEMIEKMGYDPLDYSWLERELAETPLEKKWFKYQRDNNGGFTDDWTSTIEKFNSTYKEAITINEAFDLTKKWKRFIIGAWNTISSQNANIEDWKTAAHKFESHHRDIETRMTKWSKEHEGKYPLVKVKKPVMFQAGPYFNECIERVPKLFVNKYCSLVEIGVVLRVISYDPKEKFIRLDFTPDVREKIKPGVPENEPWRPLHADYIIYVMPDEIADHLEILSPLTDAD